MSESPCNRMPPSNASSGAARQSYPPSNANLNGSLKAMVVKCGPRPMASPENLLEMQIRERHLRLSESETLTVDPSHLSFNQPH